MSTTDPTQPAPSQAPPSTAPPPVTSTEPQVDTLTVNRDEYDALQAEIQQARATFAMLNPHSARIERLVREPEYAKIFDDSVETYQRLRTSHEPQVPDEIKPIYEKVNRVAKFVDDFETRQRDEAERPQRELKARYDEWQNNPSNNRFFTRLMADHPTLKPRDISYLAQVAAENNFEPLESVWKKENWRFVQPGTSAPPSSLRADAGEVGAGTPPNAGPNGQTMRGRIIELERQRRGLTA